MMLEGHCVVQKMVNDGKKVAVQCASCPPHEMGVGLICGTRIKNFHFPVFGQITDHHPTKALHFNGLAIVCVSVGNSSIQN